MMVRIAPAVPEPRRRAADHPWYVVTFKWIFAPFVDSWRGLALTRVIAFGIFALVAHVAEQTHNISWVMFACFVCSLSAAFGKGVFSGEFLNRVSFGGAAIETREHTETDRVTTRAEKTTTPVDAPPAHDPTIPTRAE